MGILSAKPFEHLTNIYNVAFAVLILIIDGTPTLCNRCGDFQRELITFFPGLAQQRTRALLSWYVGSVNLALVPSARNTPVLSYMGPWMADVPDVAGLPRWTLSTLWGKVHLIIGAGLCASGVILFVQACLRKPRAVDK